MTPSQKSVVACACLARVNSIRAEIRNRQETGRMGTDWCSYTLSQLWYEEGQLLAAIEELQA